MVIEELVKLKIDQFDMNVKIVRKSNKNTYIRVNENLEVVITTNYLMSSAKIEKLVKENQDKIYKMIEKAKRKNEDKEVFYYKGKSYDVVLIPALKEVDIDESKVYIPSIQKLNNWYKKELYDYFMMLLKTCYNKFDENIPFPILKIRKMKSRWGVCNRKDNSITLNSELMKFDENIICYVIIHELSHFVHFNHSHDFWNLVSTYFPNYKKIRSIMKY